uniref:Uncharacterized protein n=1 Tax=Oryza meridionalis TaxID=40149 RepID=A0A0E0DX33_9ORYZ
MAAAADDLARRLAAFIPLPQPPQKEQLSGVAAAVLDAGGRLGRVVGDVFRRLRIDDGLDVAFAQRHRRNGGSRIAAAAAADAPGSMNLSATYDSRTSDVESSVVARGGLWRAEASHSSATAAAPPLFMVQLGPVLFVRDTTLLFPVHLSKRHLIWYGFERKSFMDMQFPNGQLRYVAGDGFTTRAFLPLCRGIFQAHAKFPGEKKFSYSFKVSCQMNSKPYLNLLHLNSEVSLLHRIARLNRSGGSITPMVKWPDKSLSLGTVQTLSWKRCGLMLQPALQFRQNVLNTSVLSHSHCSPMIHNICPTFGGSRPGLSMELIHSVNENTGVVCGYSHTVSPSAYASISIGRSKLNGSAASSGLVLRVDAPLHSFGRPWFSIQMNSGLEF